MIDTLPIHRKFVLTLGTIAHPLLRTVSLLYRLTMRLFSHLQERQAMRLASFVVPLVLSFLSLRSAENLKRVFGRENLTRAHLRQVRRSHMKYMSRFIVESARLLVIEAGELRHRYELVGEEHIRQALQQGKGVLLISSHLGNWLHINPRLAESGYRITTVTKQMRVSAVESRIQMLMRRFHINPAHVGDNATKLAQGAFSRNEIFSLYFDVAAQSKHCLLLPLGAGALRVDIGPAILTLRYGIPVLIASSYVTDNNSTRITITPSPQYIPVGCIAHDVEHLMRLWIRQFQHQLFLCPEQWWAWSFVYIGNAKGT